MVHSNVNNFVFVVVFMMIKKFSGRLCLELLFLDTCDGKQLSTMIIRNPLEVLFGLL